jgi:hypothetical protein
VSDLVGTHGKLRLAPVTSVRERDCNGHVFRRAVLSAARRANHWRDRWRGFAIDDTRRGKHPAVPRDIQDLTLSVRLSLQHQPRQYLTDLSNFPFEMCGWLRHRDIMRGLD